MTGEGKDRFQKNSSYPNQEGFGSSKEGVGMEVQQPGLSDGRREQRLDFESLLFPFLGSRFIDHDTFEYLPMDISFQGLKIAIPKWVVKRELLKVGQWIYLHLPFRFADRAYTEGVVRWTRWNEDTQSQLYGIEMANPRNVFYPLYIHTDTRNIRLDLGEYDSKEALLIALFKDAVLLKRGILIYLNHLVPFYSRLAERSRDDYDHLKGILFEDIRKRVSQNLEFVEEIYRSVRQQNQPVSTVLETIDLNQFREAICSEIQREVIKTALNTEAVVPYLDAIQTLEKKLYTNYNAILILLIYSLQLAS